MPARKRTLVGSRRGARRARSDALTAIAKNFFIDRLRARGLAREVPFEVLPDTSDGGPPEYDGLADPRLSAVLSTYLASLPPPLRDIYEQRLVLGNSQETSCAALRVARRRLRSHEARLLRGLRRALLQNGVMRADPPGSPPST